jgi:phage shock protein E
VMAADFTAQVEALGLDRSRPVYLYCLSGNRSGQAAKMLRRGGFEQAFNVGSYRALLRVGFENG